MPFAGAILLEPFSLPLTDPVLVMALVVGLVLTMPILARRLHIPDIVMLIVAGIVLGPHGLGILERDRAMILFGAVGLMYIMFLAGLELDAADFKRHRRRCIIFGLMSFLVPQVVGTALAMWWFDYGWAKALLLASMFASFTLLTYPQVSRLGLMQRESIMVTVGGTLITDTLALLVLAVIAQSTRHELTLGFALHLTVSVGVFFALVLWGVPRLGTWFFSKVGREGGPQFLFVLMVAFMCGSLSRLAGVEPIVGAFLAGLTLNRLVPRQSALMNRVEFIGHNLFIPFFLVSVGMVVNPRVFVADAFTWAVSAFMVGTVIATKYVAARLTQHWLGYSSDEGWVMFGLSVTQAAATLAAVMVGMELQIFDDAVLNGTLMMILATCLLSPWVTEFFGRRLALSAESGVGSRAVVESHRILVPLHNPATATELTALAMLLRDRKHAEAPLYPLWVQTAQSGMPAEIAASERMLAGALSQAVGSEVPVTPVIRVGAGVAEGIQRAVLELRISTVLLGWTRQPGVGSAVFGGIFDDVLAACTARLVVCRLVEPLNTVKRVVLAVPPNAEREMGFAETLRMIGGLAAQLNATLEIACCDSSRPILEEFTKAGRHEKSLKWATHRNWAALRATLQVADAPHALTALVAAREGAVSWRPGLNRLPRALAAAAPRRSLLIVYPPVSSGREFTPLAADHQNDALVEGAAVSHVHVAAAAEPWAGALRKVLDTMFVTEPKRAELLAALAGEVAEEFPIELNAGTVLLHAHTPQVLEPILLVLVHKDGWRLSGVASPVHILFVLFGPENGPGERHLQMLASLARLARDEMFLKRLLEAPASAGHTSS